MKRLEEMKTDKAPKAVGPYSMAVKVDNLIFVSGQIGLDPTTNILVEGIENQTEQVLKNLVSVLEVAGVNLGNVVRCDIFLKNIADFSTVNEIYGKYFSQDTKPARQTVEVSNLPKGAASMDASFKAKGVVTLEKIDTFVDGAAVKTVGQKTFKFASQLVENILTIAEGKICTTMIDLYQNEGIIAEPAGALAVSALDEVSTQIRGKHVVCILSGGNNDILRYPEIMERSLVYKGLKHYFLIEFAQKPGQLRKSVDKVLGPTDDIVRFEYIKKNSRETGPALVGIEVAKREDFTTLISKMGNIGIKYLLINPADPLYGYLI